MSTSIYFAGSIYGGRRDAGWYRQIIKFLQEYGTVLTEHVANPCVHQIEGRLTSRQIYQQDLQWLQNADVVVAEVSMPILGVGYELGYAEVLKIPVLCLFQEDNNKRLSAMIEGSLYYEHNIKTYEKGDLAGRRKLFDDFFLTSVPKQSEQPVGIHS